MAIGIFTVAVGATAALARSRVRGEILCLGEASCKVSPCAGSTFLRRSWVPGPWGNHAPWVAPQDVLTI